MHHSEYSKGGRGGRRPFQSHQIQSELFEDTSAQSGQQFYNPNAYNVQSQMEVPGMLNDPMANMAFQYTSSLADHGKDVMNANIQKYVSSSKIKYYFAVDTAYVLKKLGILTFPYVQKDWSLRYSEDEPIAPRFDVNAPDLYIPTMSLVTYILLAGIMLGVQSRFTPEQLGSTASNALLWMLIELMVILISMYLLSLKTALRYLDLVAFCGYKYFGMIASLSIGLIFEAPGYYIGLLWFSLSLAFFLVRTLKLAILPHGGDIGSSALSSNKPRLYTLLSLAMSQPLLMWFLTRSIMFK